MRNYHRWISAWIGLFESVLVILTGGFIVFSWQYKITMWFAQKNAKRINTRNNI